MKNLKYWETLKEILQAYKEDRLSEKVGEIRGGIKYSKLNDDNQLYYHFSYLYHLYNYMVKQDAKAGRRSKLEFEKAKRLLNYEETVSMDYTEITYRLNRSRKASKDLRKDIDKFCLEYEELLELNNTSISLYIFPILIINSYLNLDYNSVAKYCDQAIELFETKTQNKSQHFYSFKTLALIISGQHQYAHETINMAKKQIKGKRYTWSIYMYYETINLIHSKNYEKGYQRLLEVNKSDSITPAMKEQWQIVKAFFQVLANAGLIENIKRFKLSKILNELPIFSQDKYGNFINLLILRLVLGIQENKGRLIDEREAIERAYYRYCDKGSREQIFIRCLLRIPTYRFVKELVEKECRADLKKLQAMPMRPENIDIVPWLVLWDIVLKELH